MKRSRHNLIRELLLNSADGMTVNQIAQAIGDDNPKSVQKTVKLIWGVYIDRWTVPKRGQFSAVYMCASIPEDAPHPTERYLPQTKWQANAKMAL